VIGLESSLIIGALLILLSILVWRKALLSARELPPQGNLLLGDEQIQLEPCPLEVVSKIFSSDDRAFVLSMQCAALRKLLAAERKSLALLWVQQTSEEIRRIMREHLEFARRSADLEFATEIKLFFHYAELRLVCGFLLISIELAGPFWLRGLALYAGKLSQRVGQTHDGLLAATQAHETRSI
jgi:hypothetical protein